MTIEQEIRAKAVELHIAALALIPDAKRLKQLISWQSDDSDPREAICNGARIFEDFIKGP